MSDELSVESLTARERALAQLFKTYQRIHKSMEGELDALGLTISQFEVLCCLKKNPGLTQRELASYLSVTRGNVTGLIDRLAERGLVERQEDAEDRRVNCLYLTAQSNCVIDTMQPEYCRLAERAMASLSDDELQVLETLLARLEAAI